ncbi:MAG: AIR synthase-related protein [Patescibacteria group bacterium]|jgi:phosphoribosylformylglycinamidine synthase
MRKGESDDMAVINALYKTRKGPDPVADQLLAQLRRSGYPQLTEVKLERVLRTEGLDMGKTWKFKRMFAHPVLETVRKASQLKPARGPIVEVCYKRGVTDPELESTKHAAEALKVKGLLWARYSDRYQFVGVDEATARQIVQRFYCNAQVQTVVEPGEVWETLMPQGQVAPVEMIDIARMNLQLMQELSETRRLFMPDEQLQRVKRFFKDEEPRPMRDGEIEMLAAAWCEHCKHTSMKALGQLQVLQRATAQINHPLVISAYVDNSGVMRFFDGWALCAKGETHIAPSALSTYGGVMTKLGGVIRDIIFTGQGAMPIFGTTIMGTCDPRMPWNLVLPGALHPVVILRESIRAAKDYGNPMGIPMACWQYLLHPNFVKCFALGHSVGILPESRAQKGQPVAGDFVVYIGGETGNDGVHGATFSSGAMTSQTAVVDATSVQIGMPIEEAMFMYAIPVLRDRGCIRAHTDCGAAGLASAVGEMGSETGVWINLAFVPRKCKAMRKCDILLSESQERGVLCIPPDKLDEAIEILQSFGVRVRVIGVFTDTKRFQAVYDDDQNNNFFVTNPSTATLRGEIVVDLPYTLLSDECPLPVIEVSEPKVKPVAFMPAVPVDEKSWRNLNVRHLGHYNLADQSAAGHQFDQTVQGGSKLRYTSGLLERMPDELAAKTPILGRPYTAGVANAVNAFYGAVDPSGLGRHMMGQAFARMVAAGFSPDDIVCNVNVYSPRLPGYPENAWRLVQLIEHGYAPASIDLGMPVISGKDSVGGTFVLPDGSVIHAPLTCDVLAVGRMPDYRRLIPKPFTKPGDRIVLFHPGLKAVHLGGSILCDLFGQTGDRLPEINLKEVREGLLKFHRMMENLGWSDGVHSRSVIAEGGLIRRLFEMSIGQGMGCRIDLPKSMDDVMNWLYGELNAAILFAVSSDSFQRDLPGEFEIIGEVVAEPEITVSCAGDRLFTQMTDEMATQWLTTFREVAI